MSLLVRLPVMWVLGNLLWLLSCNSYSLHHPPDISTSWKRRQSLLYLLLFSLSFCACYPFIRNPFPSFSCGSSVNLRFSLDAGFLVPLLGIPERPPSLYSTKTEPLSPIPSTTVAFILFCSFFLPLGGLHKGIKCWKTRAVSYTPFIPRTQHMTSYQ